MRSGYSANERTGDAIQIRGTKNPTHASTTMPASSGVLWLLATLTVRLRRPCGARMAISTTTPASTSAFAIHGFMVKHVPLPAIGILGHHPNRLVAIALDHKALRGRNGIESELVTRVFVF